jgi:hypothetical protein
MKLKTAKAVCILGERASDIYKKVVKEQTQTSCKKRSDARLLSMIGHDLLAE